MVIKALLETNRSIESAFKPDTAEPSDSGMNDTGAEPSSEPSSEPDTGNDDGLVVAGVGDLIITEIMMDPQMVEDQFGEWIELQNLTDNMIFGLSPE